MNPSTAIEPPLTVADLLERLGGMSAKRIRLCPAPGTAREEDVVAVRDRRGRLTVGAPRATLAVWGARGIGADV